MSEDKADGFQVLLSQLVKSLDPETRERFNENVSTWLKTADQAPQSARDYVWYFHNSRLEDKENE